MFITFEGIEGSGKTSQIKLLKDYLIQKKINVIQTREPGGTKIGDQIRKILLDSQNKEMTSYCELLLYLAARSQHVEEHIIPYLNKNYYVLCDRFIDATLAYQCYSRKIPLDFVNHIHKTILKNLNIDLTFLFDLPVEIGLQRAQNRENQIERAYREDRFEQESLSFHESVRQGYLKLAKDNPQRFVMINANQSVEEIFLDIKTSMEERMK